MIKSMTGFGKCSIEFASKSISIEIKSLNSKQFDAYLRIPPLYREKEAEIRQMLTAGMSRGKVELNINIDNNGEESNFNFNRALAKQYYEEIKGLSGELGIDLSNEVISTLVKMPEVLKAQQAELSGEEWEKVRNAILDAIDQLNAFRAQEGLSLEQDLKERVHKIDHLLSEVKQYEEQRILNLRERLLKQLEENFPQGTADMNRFEQEIIYYLEKLDITEEKVRLGKHCQYFLETLADNGTNGKKLGFISQEMGREINTLGSKANDADMQKVVVLMKDELEKIKEQLFNIL
ncbi:MAG: YicC/YloC family endoribonuclease [Bacteroidota bacterium]